VIVAQRGVADMGHAPRIHHRPKVFKSFNMNHWWSTCTCGHIVFRDTWRQAFVDAMVHSQELR
jgi:hypothetical protein